MADVDSAGLAGDDEIEYETAPIEGYESRLYLLTLPEVGSKRPKKWVFNRAMEYFLFGTEASAGNLCHVLEDLELAGAVRHLKPSSIQCLGMSREQFDATMSLFNEWCVNLVFSGMPCYLTHTLRRRKSLDPLCSNKVREVCITAYT